MFQTHRMISDINSNTQTLKQSIEYWPKYEIYFNPLNDTQRAYLIFLVFTAQNLFIISKNGILGNNSKRRWTHHEVIISQL